MTIIVVTFIVHNEVKMIIKSHYTVQNFNCEFKLVLIPLCMVGTLQNKKYVGMTSWLGWANKDLRLF